MIIKEVEIKNFRLLKNCIFNLDRELNVIVGKNNTGKTSLLYCMDKFLNKNKDNPFRYDDVSISLQTELEQMIIDEEIISRELYDSKFIGISLKLIISYNEDDNISYLSKLMTDLGDENNKVYLCFEYSLSYDEFIKLREKYFEFRNKGINKNVKWFISRNCNNYFVIKKYGYDVNENNCIMIDSSLLSKIINFSYINAKREVSNDINLKNGSIRSELSKLSYDYLKDNKDEILKEKIEELNMKLLEMDAILDIQYKEIFKDLYNDLIEYGFSDEGSNIEIQSRLSEINVIQDNTLLLYDINGTKLPETYNGLGFLNFYSLILKINSILLNFKKNSNKAINILMIEEPEAHTHPQMQYIFINNIKKVLKKYEDEINVCSIITTHSSQIISQAGYDDILCFIRKGSNAEVDVKSLKLFLDNYKRSDKEEDKKTYEFLNKYLTLVNSEIFFTDKLIICEGITERILLPIFIKLHDKKDKSNCPLGSQKYSIIESGAYSQNLRPFIDLLGIKTLIITDIDFVNGNNKCECKDATGTSNSSLKAFLDDSSIEALKKQSGVYVTNNIGITFQHCQNDYHARSFEDAYISVNYDYLKENIEKFESITHKDIFMLKNYYEIANNCINSKSTFATEIVFNSEEEFENINVPSYIEDGIKWLASKK